jgi:putative oxidoreductase
MINFFDLLGRIFISSIFLFSGIDKILNYEGTIQWMEGFGVSKIFLAPAIILEIIFSLLIIIGYKTKIAASMLAIFCLLTAFIFHNDFSNQMQIIAFLKNMGLVAGLLFLIINGTKDWSIEKKKKYVRL